MLLLILASKILNNFSFKKPQQQQEASIHRIRKARRTSPNMNWRKNKLRININLILLVVGSSMNCFWSRQQLNVQFLFYIASDAAAALLKLRSFFIIISMMMIVNQVFLHCPLFFAIHFLVLKCSHIHSNCAYGYMQNWCNAFFSRWWWCWWWQMMRKFSRIRMRTNWRLWWGFLRRMKVKVEKKKFLDARK